MVTGVKTRRGSNNMLTDAMFNGFFISDITRAKLYVQFFRPK